MSSCESNSHEIVRVFKDGPVEVFVPLRIVPPISSIVLVWPHSCSLLTQFAWSTYSGKPRFEDIPACNGTALEGEGGSPSTSGQCRYKQGCPRIEAPHCVTHGRRCPEKKQILDIVPGHDNLSGPADRAILHYNRHDF